MLTFRELFGPASELQALMDERQKMDDVRQQFAAHIERLELARDRKFAELDREASQKQREMESAEQVALTELRESRKCAINEDKEGVLQYLMDGSDADDDVDAKVKDIRKQFADKSLALDAKLGKLKNQIEEQLEKARAKLLKEVERDEETFARRSRGHSLAVVYCDGCGEVLGVCESPRTAGEAVTGLDNVLQQLLIMHRQNQESVDALQNSLQSIERGLNLSASATMEAIQKLSEMAVGIAQIASTVKAEEQRTALERLSQYFGPGQ